MKKTSGQSKSAAGESLSFNPQMVFEKLKQGFCLIKKLNSRLVKLSDYQYIYVNTAFKLATGLPDVTGKTLREIVPAVQQEIVDLYDEVLATGVPGRFESYISDLDRWLAADIYAAGPEGQLAIVFNDVTEKRRSERASQREARRHAFFLKLSDELKPLSHPVDVKINACRLLGEQLNVQLVEYAEVDLARDLLTVKRGHYKKTNWDTVGEYDLRHFPVHMSGWTSGKTMVIDDVAADIQLSEIERTEMIDAGIGAELSVPLLKNGRLVAIMKILHDGPRIWNSEEIQLLQETAERTWEAAERARVEGLLQKSENRFRSFLSASSNMVYRMSADWRHMFALSGKNYLEDITEPVYNWIDIYIPEAERERVNAAIKRAVDNKETFELEHQIYIANGDIVWAHSKAIPLLNNEGEIEEWIGAASNITVRKAAETQLTNFNDVLELQVKQRTAELRDNQVLLKTVIESSFAYIQVLKAVRNAADCIVDFTWLLVNKRFVEYYGDMTGRSFINRNQNDVDSGIFADMVSVVESGKPIVREQFFRHGQLEGWLHIVIAKMDGGVIITMDDITARKRAELELQSERNRLQSVFDTTLIQLSILKAIRNKKGSIDDLEIMLVNKELEKETGRKDLIGKRYAEEYPGIKHAGIFELIIKTIETGEPQQLEYYYPHEGFYKWFSCMFVKMEDGVVATNMDITERKRAEEERFNNYTLLQHSEEMALLGSWEFDLQTGVFKWSDGMYRLFELEKGTHIEPEIYMQYATTNGRAAAERVTRHIRFGISDFEETIELSINGKIKIIYLKGSVVKDAAGKPLRVLGVDMDVTALRLAEEKIRSMEAEQQQEIIKTTLTTLEEERRRISESLHNGLGQIMYGVKINLNALSKEQTWDDFERTKHYTDKLLSDAIGESRRISHELMPSVLDEFGLKAAIDDICAQLDDGVKFSCKYKSTVVKLERYLELAIYRFIQELMTNVIKHAEATLAKVEVTVSATKIDILVADNGRGLIVKEGQSKPGIGLISIKSKIKLLSGSIKFSSGKPIGTTVTISIPLAQ